MSTPDLNSIFSQGWFSDNGEVTDGQSISTQGWGEADLGEEDYANYPVQPFDRFNKEGTDYNPESELYDLLITEAINMHGIPMVYYVTTYNVEYDKVVGEDANRMVERMFNIQAYYDLPNEQEIWTRWGLEGLDNFHMIISQRHFKGMSTFDQYGNPNVHPQYTPQEGDIIKSRYNNYIYEILTVKQQAHQLHRRVHVWDLIVKPMKDHHFIVSGAIRFERMDQYQDISDIFSVSGAVDTEKDYKGYVTPETEEKTDPFLDW